MRQLLLFLLCFALVSQTFAQETDDLLDLSLDELMNMEITVASGKKALTQKESPGIVTVVTSEEIQKSGARDLIDVLRLVPGINFVSDVQNVVSIGMRGNTGTEGKVLLLFNGVELNEDLYTTTQFGNHISPDHIKRIEIIRGPGSALYGGYAELGVINIVTKDAETLDGVTANAKYGMYADQMGRTNVNLMAGKKFGDLSLSLLTFYGAANRNNDKYSDIFGATSETNEGILELNNMFVNFDAKYKDFSLTFLYDGYNNTSIDLFDNILAKPVAIDFKTMAIRASYEYNIGDNFSLTPTVTYKNQKPWYADDKEQYFFDFNLNKIKANLLASWDIDEMFNLTGGMEYYTLSSETKDIENSGGFADGTESKVDYNNIAVFAQALLKHKIANLTVGARMDNHSKTGSAFAPRIGITKKIDDLHLKALYSQAFRSPSIFNIDLAPNNEIDPEQTSVIELEVGYQLNPKMQLTANVYHITIDKTIVYFYDSETEEEIYKNEGKTGTMGFEFEYRYRDDWGYANLSYSYYKANDVEVDYYTIPDEDGLLLGLPGNKIAFSGSLNLTDKLSLNPSLMYITKRYSNTAYDLEADDVIITADDGKLLLNANLLYKDLLISGLNVSLAAYDITDSGFSFYQPYKGGHAPMPSGGLEMLFKVQYHFGK